MSTLPAKRDLLFKHRSTKRPRYFLDKGFGKNSERDDVKPGKSTDPQAIPTPSKVKVQTHKLAASESLLLSGSALLSVVEGSCDVDGFIISTDTTPQKVFSNDLKNEHCIEVRAGMAGATVETSEIPDYPGYKVISIHCDPPRVRRAADWVAAVERICSKSSPRVVVCGRRNSGKSTFGRFLVNNLLKLKGEVLFLDCDVGQSEFLVEGCLSLHRVRCPLLGAPWTHQDVSPIAAFYLGSNDLNMDPELYMSCIRSVVKEYATLGSDLPVVVNTIGWIKGLGLESLTYIIKLLKPTAVVELSLDAEQILEESSGDRIQLMSYSMTSSEYKEGKQLAWTNRSATMTSYFCGRPFVKLAGELLVRLPSYRVPFESVAVHFLHRESPIPERQLLRALNGTVVGLACMREKLPKSETGCLKVLNEFQEPPPCVGCGIIRAIDLSTSCFYVITPVPAERLRAVNVFLRGVVKLYKHLLMQTSDYKGTLYLVNDTSALGGKELSTRKDIRRTSPRKNLVQVPSPPRS